VQKGNARLYNRGGIARTKAALHSGGRVVFWSANPDKDFARSLENVFKSVECIGAKAYPKANDSPTPCSLRTGIDRIRQFTTLDP
jgi:hypothetical protein